MKEQLKLLKIEEIELKKKLSENKENQNLLIVNIFIKELGLNIGDSVQIDNGKKGIIYAFNVSCGTVYPIIRLFKRDGTIGMREIKIYSFNKLTKLNERA